MRALRDAGAIVIGKTHVPELTICRSRSRSPSAPRAIPGRWTTRPAARAAGGRRRGRRHGRRRPGLRRRRLDPHPGGVLRPVRAQAPARPHLARAQARGVARPGRRRTAGAAGRGRRALPGGRGGRRRVRRGRRARAGAAAGRRLDQAAAGRAGAAGRRAAPRGRRDRGAPALARPRRRRARDRLRAGGVAEPGGALPARDPRRRATASSTRAPRAADPRRWRGSAHWCPPGSSRGRAPPRRRSAARINAIFDHADVVLTPGPAGPPFRVGQFHGRGALWTLNAVAARVPYYGLFNVTGQPARLGARRPRRRRACRSPSSSSGAPATRRPCSRWPPRSSRRARGPTAARSCEHRGPARRRGGRGARLGRCAARVLRARRERGRGQVDAHRPRLRGGPRGRAGDPRAASPRAGPTTRSWGRRATTCPAPPGCAGSSTRSTAPSTTCSGSRSGACRSRARARSASSSIPCATSSSPCA